jgi:tetratricopeptide (TPR) repeat protein
MQKQVIGLLLGVIISLTGFTSNCQADIPRQKPILRYPNRAWAVAANLEGFAIVETTQIEGSVALHAKHDLSEMKIWILIEEITTTDQTQEQYIKENWERLQPRLPGSVESVRFSEEGEGMKAIYYIPEIRDKRVFMRGYFIVRRFDNTWIQVRLEKMQYRASVAQAIDDLIKSIDIYRYYQGNDESEEAKLMRNATLVHDNSMSQQIQSDLQKVIELNPDNALAHLLLGDLHYRQGSSKEALESFRSALVSAKKNKSFTLFQTKYLIETLISLETNPKQLEAILKTGTEIEPDYPRFSYELSRYYARQGKKKLAVEHLDQACRKALFYPGEKLPNPEEEDDFKSLKEQKDFQLLLNKYYSLFDL